jgi:hypothetical protein
MTNHPGDHYSFLTLARLREEQLERKSKQRALVQQAPYRPGLRAAIAGFLRSTADRLEAPRTAELPARRYQRAP